MPLSQTGVWLELGGGGDNVDVGSCIYWGQFGGCRKELRVRTESTVTGPEQYFRLVTEEGIPLHQPLALLYIPHPFQLKTIRRPSLAKPIHSLAIYVG